MFPGPAMTGTLQKIGTQRMVFCSVEGGAGLDIEEGGIDRPLLTVRTIGHQHNYDDSEQLAMLVDSILASADSRGAINMNGKKVLALSRTGARPVLSEWDSADRFHFTCSYVVFSLR